MSQQFDALAQLPERLRERFYINGQWQKPLSANRLELISPVTESCCAICGRPRWARPPASPIC